MDIFHNEAPIEFEAADLFLAIYDIINGIFI